MNQKSITNHKSSFSQRAPGRKSIGTKNSSNFSPQRNEKQNRLFFIAAKQHSERPNRFGRRHYKKNRYNTPRKSPQWLAARRRWIIRKQIRHQIALLRHETWLAKRRKWMRRNKRPFWKRKSFKRIRAEQNILENMFMVVKNQSTHSSMADKRASSKKTLARRYFRANSVRREFKTRIILRHYWKYRYGYYTHNKLQNFLLSVKKKSHRLLYFFTKFELVLYRYARWWGLIPTFCDDRLARSLVVHGYMYVNFKPEVNPWYQVKKQDCIFAIAKPRSFGNLFITPKYATLYGHVKYHPGRREFKKTKRRVWAPFRMRPYLSKRWKRKTWRSEWLENQYRNSDTLYLKVRSILKISTWAPRLATHYFLVLEISYKIKMLVSMTGYDWFTIAFGVVRGFFDNNALLANRFIGMSYW